MALIRWTHKYSVGVEIVDDQHKGMVAMLNELHAAMLKGKGQSVADPLMKKLLEYTGDHFATEERLMLDSGYAGLAHHRAIHADLTSKVLEYVGRRRANDPTMYPPLLRFLRDWLTTHIQGEDKAFGPWLNTHGIR